jgi:hypothetical protein
MFESVETCVKGYKKDLMRQKLRSRVFYWSKTSIECILTNENPKIGDKTHSNKSFITSRPVQNKPVLNKECTVCY